MTVSNYRGFESLKEVECSGTTLPNEVKFLSLTLFRKTKSLEEITLAIIETSMGTYNCHTFTEMSLCINDDGDKRNSVVKTLVSDLEGGERTYIGCNYTAFSKFKNKVFQGSWNMEVFRQSELFKLWTSGLI